MIRSFSHGKRLSYRLGDGFAHMGRTNAKTYLAILLIGGVLILVGLTVTAMTMPKILAILLGITSLLMVIGADYSTWACARDLARYELRQDATKAAWSRIHSDRSFRDNAILR